MPYIQQWVPAPTDENIEVLKEKPDKDYLYYHCQYCKGWIEGQPNKFKEDSISLLAGRRGTVEYCRRCGQEIGFFGIRS